MQVITRVSGVQLRLPDDVFVHEVTGGEVPVQRRRGGSGLPTESIPTPDSQAASPMSGGTDSVVASMQAQGLTLVDAFEMAAPSAPSNLMRRRGPSGAEGQGGELAVQVAEAEDAVLLLEQDGVYSWHYPTEAKTEVRGVTRRGPRVVPATKVLVFEVQLEPAGPRVIQRRGARGPIGDFIKGKVRAYVLKFVARVAVGQVMKFMERNTRRGLVVMDSSDPGRWHRVEDLSALELPADRPARVLLFVHGTFSSTLGSFGALGAADWGRSFLEIARRQYDLVVGYDHPTLSDDPLENAADLLARLERGQPARPPVIDAIAYSRGALVLRSLIEYLLPSSPLGVRVRRAVFVGGTNGGTELAETANWKRLVDLYTNLAVAGCRAIGFLAPGSQVPALILQESIQTLGALVKYLTVNALDDGGIPGLAAMSPHGKFVARINAAQPGQPGVSDSFYCVVTSQFDVNLIPRDKSSAHELPQHLVQWILDGFADGLMREPNDLVVNTAAMSQIDAATGAFVKDRLDFGRNPHVYHTVYFTRPELVNALSRWLGLDLAAAPALLAQRTRVGTMPAAADADLTIASADDSFDGVIKSVRRELPSHVLIERREPGQTYHYAFRTEELLQLADSLDAAGTFDLTVRDALQSEPAKAMQPSSSPVRVSRGAPLPELAGRAIVFDGDLPVAVVEPPGELLSSEELGGLASRVAQAPASDGEATRSATGRRRGGSRRSAMPTAEPPEMAPEAPAPEPPLSPRDRFYFAASMPNSVVVDETAVIQVAISRDVMEAVESAVGHSGSAEVDRTRNLIVQVIGKKDLEVVGEDRFECPPDDLGRRTDLVFEVKGTDAGVGEVWVLFRQGPMILVLLRLEPQVVGSAVTGPRGRIDVAADAAPEPPVARPYPLLQIIEVNIGGQPAYKFLLDTVDGPPRSCNSKPLEGKREDYVAHLYKEIEDRWVSSRMDVKAFEQEMRAYGGQILDDLVPVEIQHDLWELRDQLRAIHVLSEEPFIPWEMVHLKPPPPPGGLPSPLPEECHFLAQKGLVRWLFNRGNTAREIRIRPGRAFYVIPDYPKNDLKLPAAQAEIEFLTKNLHAQEWPAESNKIREILAEPGAVDLFHFSGHGKADSNDAELAHIELLGRVEGGRYIPNYLNSTLVQQSARLIGPDGNRPLVILNACQVGRAGWQLTSIGGFAEAFLRAGAGAFVGTLWSVGDEPAKTFTNVLYTKLLAGQSLAEAASAGREQARSAGEATWLAYVVYGHPLATVRVFAAEAPTGSTSSVP